LPIPVITLAITGIIFMVTPQVIKPLYNPSGTTSMASSRGIHGGYYH
jgi:hypothetical protein